MVADMTTGRGIVTIIWFTRNRLIPANNEMRNSKESKVNHFNIKKSETKTLERKKNKHDFGLDKGRNTFAARDDGRRSAGTHTLLPVMWVLEACESETDRKE